MTPGTPQVIDTRAVADGAQGLGAQWSLRGERELEVNLVHIPADEGIADHFGSVDVVVVGVAGEGTVSIEEQAYELRAGLLAFVPSGSTRSFRGGSSGLTYLTIHRRRDEGLAVGPTRGRPATE
jgi:quercetin dioxygenase-like cupin family protein